jgi:hypothetical protein
MPPLKDRLWGDSQYIEQYRSRGSVLQLKVPLPGAERPPSSPVVTSPVTIPAMEAILITLDGLCEVAPLARRECKPTVATEFQ